MDNNESFKTKDIVLASTLYADGQKLEGTEISKSRQVTFTFKDKTVCEDLVSKHYSGELILPSRQFFDALRTLKSIIFNS